MPQRRSRRGIALMLVAVAAFSVMDATLKWLAPHYPPLEIATLRGLASLPLVLLWIVARGRIATLRKVRWRLHLLRGAISILMMVLFVLGLRELPMSTAYVLTYAAPMLIAGLAGPVLGERVGRARWLAIGTGFAGVFVVLRPTGDGFASLAGLYILLAAACYAISAIVIRVLSRSDSSEAILFWLLAMLSVGAGVLAAPEWQPMRVEDAAPIALLGTTGALGQWAVTRAFTLAEASLIAPLEYSSLLWAVALDALIWRTAPDPSAMLGGAIIVAAGIALIRFESRLAPANPDLDVPP